MEHQRNIEIGSDEGAQKRFWVYLVPFHIFIYSVGAIWLLFDGWINNFSSLYRLWGVEVGGVLPENVVFLSFTILGSMLGSALLGIISFHRYKAIEKTFDADHVWGFLFLPLLAVIIGILTFALVQSGLFVLSGQTEDSNISHNATLGYLAIGGVTGYNWDVFVRKLQELSKNVLNTPSSEKQ